MQYIFHGEKTKKNPGFYFTCSTAENPKRSFRGKMLIMFSSFLPTVNYEIKSREDRGLQFTNSSNSFSERS